MIHGQDKTSTELNCQQEKDSTSRTTANSNNENDALSETRAAPPVSRIPSQRYLWGTVDPSEPTTLPAEPSESVPTLIEPLSKLATKVYTLSYLVFFSIFGTLARIGLQSLTIYPGAPVSTGVVWANVGGSLIMGFLVEDQSLFFDEWGNNSSRTASRTQRDRLVEPEEVKKHKAVKKTIPLYIGLTTGFCGCFTSYSTFMRDVFLALANRIPDPSTTATTSILPRSAGDSFMAVVAVILLNVALSLSALIFGAHLALALHPLTPTFPYRLTRKFLDRLFVLLGWGCWLGAVIMAIWPPDRSHGGNPPEVWRGRAVLAIVFAPLGCLLRFYVSLWLNSRLLRFPLGTFAVNMFGTMVEAMCYDLQHVNGIGASAVAVAPGALTSVYTGCQVLQGVMDGFCGSCTTVSTWVAELNGLGRRRSAYLYGLISVAVGLGLMVVIMGSVLWTKGFHPPLCIS